VFLRALIPGGVKTRLAAAVGDTAALDLYRAMLADLAERISEPDERAVVPFIDQAGPTGPFERPRPQRGQNLFIRMANAIEEAIAGGAPRVVLIGTDIPLLSSARIGELFAALRGHDAVIGPSRDGGYYAVGFTASGYRRSVIASPGDAGESDVLSRTEQAMDRAGLAHCRGPVLADVDTIDDLIAVLGDPESYGQCPNLHHEATKLGLEPT
jgi:hypothetical protein